MHLTVFGVTPTKVRPAKARVKPRHDDDRIIAIKLVRVVETVVENRTKFFSCLSPYDKYHSMQKISDYHKAPIRLNERHIIHSILVSTLNTSPRCAMVPPTSYANCVGLHDERHQRRSDTTAGSQTETWRTNVHTHSYPPMDGQSSWWSRSFCNSRIAARPMHVVADYTQESLFNGWQTYISINTMSLPRLGKEWSFIFTKVGYKTELRRMISEIGEEIRYLGHEEETTYSLDSGVRSIHGWLSVLIPIT